MTREKITFEIQDNFLPVRGYMDDPFSAEGEAIAQAIAAAIYADEVYRRHLARLEGNMIKWCDSLALCARAVLFGWLAVAGACPLDIFAGLGYDAGEAWTICREIDEQIKQYLKDWDR